jgi:hypothetical protein
MEIPQKILKTSKILLLLMNLTIIIISSAVRLSIEKLTVRNKLLNKTGACDVLKQDYES